MSEQINYRKIVNQQLAGAAFQLSLINSETLQLSKLQINSCIQSNIQHLVLAIEAYINEVLSNYKRTTIDFSLTSVEQLLIHDQLKTHSIVELNEIQQWYAAKTSNFFRIFQFKASLLDNSQLKKTNQNENVIAVSSDANQDFWFNEVNLQALNQEITKLIDRQRESLLEQ